MRDPVLQNRCYLSRNKISRVGHYNLALLHFAQGFTYYLLGQARTFATLTGNAQRFTDFTVAAATFVDCFADLTVGDTFAEADVHRLGPSLG